MFSGLAELLQWAKLALGFARGAGGGAEVHHCLVEKGGLAGGDHFSCQGPEFFQGRFFFGVGLNFKEPAKYADNVAVEDRFVQIKGDAGDGAGGVGTDAR